ncbi:MAG: hypothetical protein NT147_07845 [Candidatus Aminicenantes bacterium]|nr:hypothetical protein [Candidatus Aminicenantes bacterium]
MKRALIFVAVIGLTASLGAQSLVELAKREKERREGFSGRHAVVVKNRDLRWVKKTAAVVVTNPDIVPGDDLRSAAATTTKASGDAGPAAPPSGSKAAARPALTGDNANDDLSEGSGPLEDQLKVVDELVDQLTTEMNALLQQFEAQNSMVPGSVIQQQIEETNQRLVQAQARQSRILARMGKKGLAIRKDPGSVDR